MRRPARRGAGTQAGGGFVLLAEQARASTHPRGMVARRTTRHRGICLALITAALLLAAASSASAATSAAGWTIESFASPTNFSSGDNAVCVSQGKCDTYSVTAMNAGSRPTDGSPVTFSDTLPAGVTVQHVSFFWSGDVRVGLSPRTDLVPLGRLFGAEICTTAAPQVSCTFPGFLEPFGVLAEPDDRLEMVITVTVDDPNASGPLPPNAATISGGGAASASVTAQNQVSSSSPAFGFSSFNFYIDGLDGARDTQAGDHPYELTTTIGLNSRFRPGPENTFAATSVQDVKDVVVDLPLGFVGSTLSAPRCGLARLTSVGGCPPDTQVGHIFTEPRRNDTDVDSAIYNLVPERGVPAEFGYLDAVKASHVFYAHVVPTPRGYVLETINPDVPQVSLAHIIVTFFGNPAVRDGSGNAPIPFFTNPTGCASGPLRATIHMDSWQSPGRFNADGTPDFSDPAWASAESESPAVTGCNALQFAPELKAQPTTSVADSPSGLEFEMNLPQSEDAGVHATPALKRAVVRLPEGMTVDPSAGDGLGACSTAQIGWVGPSTMNFNPARPGCPEASKIGSLELTTPLIPGTLTGAMYLASQNDNPFHSVLAAYVVVDDPVTGVLLKIAGEFKTDPRTGRLTAVFDENPQLPFSDLKLHFFGGPRAELATPESCGTFTTTSELAPWSAPDSGPDAMPFDSFLVSSGCVNGFSPAFAAGTTNLQAGAFTPFVASFSRADIDQDLAGLSVTLPPGLLAKISGVPLCPDADASAGTCPEASQVGSVRAGAGPGPNPLFVTGKAYLTGPYKGGPYGLAVVVPAVAGPFNFGTVVVRQSLHIDPSDAHVTDISDPFPTILNPVGTNGQANGIPIRLRRIDVSIDRPGFTFNPTNCSKLQVAGTLSSVQGATSTLTSPFQVTNCATLAFKPDFKVSVSGKSSKAAGAGLSVKLAYPKGPLGSEANIGRVKVELPVQLPSRLTTLQQACLAATFDANPASCPAASIVGHAKVITPLLPTPLEGPAYFVSHGGAAFPDLTIVLQGSGVTIKLVGTTFISKKGITSTTFKSPPDTPFDTFELALPQGKYSALAANVNLCAATTLTTIKKRVTVRRHGRTTHPLRNIKQRIAQSLLMPTEFTAQNGAQLHQNTKITVTGCPKASKPKHKPKRGKK
jgi:uncharacterized repeat protein (TIGR01451 family)